MKKNIIISGIDGQDGNILRNKLNKDKKFKIFGIGRKGIHFKNKIFKASNILNHKKKLDLFFKKNKPHIVLHLASNNPSFGEKNKKIFYQQNLKITMELFNSVFDNYSNSKFIFFSSSQIFKKKSGIINEKSKTSSNSDYTKFRIEAHQKMLKYKKINKINYTNVILFNHDSKFRNRKFILPRIVMALRNKNKKFLRSIISKNIYSDFSHADDICDGILRIIKSNFNFDKIILASGKVTSLNSIIKYLILKNKINLNLNFDKIKKKGNVILGDIRLANSKVNWKPKKNIFIAADELYNYYKKLNVL